MVETELVHEHLENQEEAAEEIVEVEPRQLPLWEIENPLKAQIGPEFFRRIPQTPGVYQLRTLDGEVLYVGKAKNLRTRIRYYRSKTLMTSGARKLRELVRKVELIEFEETETEAAALLRENELLASLKPPYNVANTRPESYPYIAFRVQADELEMRFVFSPTGLPEGFKIYGAFKATGHALRAFGALLRQICLWYSPDTIWPARLMRPKTPRAFVFQNLSAAEVKDAAERLHKILGGADIQIWPDPPAVLESVFYKNWWTIDIGRLERLTKACAHLHHLRNAFGIKTTYIENGRLDDCIVLSSHYRLRPRAPEITSDQTSDQAKHTADTGPNADVKTQSLVNIP